MFKLLASPRTLAAAAAAAVSVTAAAASAPHLREHASMAAAQAEALSFDEVAFQKHLRTKVLGRQFEFYYSLASTMETAKLALNAAHTKPSALHGKIIMADRQTAGIGRRGRGWTSDPEGNIYISLIYAPPGFENKSADLLREMMKLNLAISVATARACHAAGVHAARVKWPNDVWIKGKKVSGMLVNFDGRAAAIAGIGINVNQDWTKVPESDDINATSLRDQLGATAHREHVLANFCNELEGLMELSWDEVRGYYNELNLLNGRVVRVYHKARGIDDERDYNAEVLGIGDDGGLVVRNLKTNEQKVLSGEEITVRPT